MKPVGRRDFIKYSGGLVGLSLLGQYTWFPWPRRSSIGEPEQPPTEKARGRADGRDTIADSHNKFTMVIDAGSCIGCRRCMWGCKEENNTPDTISPLWIELFEVKSDVSVTGHPSPQDLKSGATTSYTKSPLPGRWYFGAQCNHCDNPPCVKVCPTGATHKEADGLVLMDYDRCIGCRLCVVACPYSARRFNWWEGAVPADKVNPLVPLRPVGVVEKCTFCVHRTRRGQLPRCVEVCPVRARHFGNLKDPESEVAKILKSYMGFRLLEELNTDPNIWYITRGKKWTED